MSVQKETERVDQLEKTVAAHSERLADGDATIDNLREDVRQLKRALEEMNKSLTTIAEVLRVWSSVKGFATTMRVLWAVLKALAVVGGLLAGIYYFGKHGEWPGR